MIAITDLLLRPDTIIQIDSLRTLALHACEQTGGVYYRGQADAEWELTPTIARISQSHPFAGKEISHEDLERKESLFYHRFRRHTYTHFGRVLSEWETLFLARHHNLPVRLIDWTSNPLVALYFACAYYKENENKSDGVIWWFRRPTRPMYVDVFNEEKQPFEYQGIQLVFPYYPTSRMTAQSGVFTIHSPPYWRDLRKLKKAEAVDNKEELFDIAEGGRWIIPKGSKQAILGHLDRFGINDRVLFPELDGLVKGLMHTEVFRDAGEYKW